MQPARNDRSQKEYQDMENDLMPSGAPPPRKHSVIVLISLHYVIMEQKPCNSKFACNSDIICHPVC